MREALEKRLQSKQKENVYGDRSYLREISASLLLPQNISFEEREISRLMKYGC
jgi:hypothetical protein